MKTKLFIVAAITAMLFACQTMNAQLKYGVHAAANLETQAELGQLWNNVDLYQGFLIGAFIDYSFGNTISVQTELNYQKKGGKFNGSPEGTGAVIRREFNYLTIPVLAKANFHDQGLGEKCDLALFTGPYIGFLTSVHSNIKTGSITTPVDINSQAEKTDWGLIFGGGVSYNLVNGGAIIAELRYQMGLNKVDAQDPCLRNKGMGITLGYRF